MKRKTNPNERDIVENPENAQNIIWQRKGQREVRHDKEMQRKIEGDSVGKWISEGEIAPDKEFDRIKLFHDDFACGDA